MKNLKPRLFEMGTDGFKCYSGSVASLTYMPGRLKTLASETDASHPASVIDGVREFQSHFNMAKMDEASLSAKTSLQSFRDLLNNAAPDPVTIGGVTSPNAHVAIVQFSCRYLTRLWASIDREGCRVAIEGGSDPDTFDAELLGKSWEAAKHFIESCPNADWGLLRALVERERSHVMGPLEEHLEKLADVQVSMTAGSAAATESIDDQVKPSGDLWNRYRFQKEWVAKFRKKEDEYIANQHFRFMLEAYTIDYPDDAQAGIRDFQNARAKYDEKFGPVIPYKQR